MVALDVQQLQAVLALSGGKKKRFRFFFVFLSIFLLCHNLKSSKKDCLIFEGFAAVMIYEKCESLPGKNSQIKLSRKCNRLQ